VAGAGKGRRGLPVAGTLLVVGRVGAGGHLGGRAHVAPSVHLIAKTDRAGLDRHEIGERGVASLKDVAHAAFLTRVADDAQTVATRCAAGSGGYAVLRLAEALPIGGTRAEHLAIALELSLEANCAIATSVLAAVSGRHARADR